MLNQFSRTQLLYGRDAMGYFASCRIAVAGLIIAGEIIKDLASKEHNASKKG